jgi:NAD(P)H-hydrate epimerase
MERAMEELGRFDVVVAGPGLAPADIDTVRPHLAKAENVVLDAGGLTPAGLAAAKQGGARVVVTPHDAEFARLAGVGAGTFSIRGFALREDVTVVRKGNPTMVSDGGLPVLVTSGGPELASIGTGDVLAGMIAALWARGLAPTEAAISAVYWHGLAGSTLSRRQTVTASALSEHISTYAW